MDLNQNQSESHDQIEEEEDEPPIDFKSSAQVWFFYEIDSSAARDIKKRNHQFTNLRILSEHC